MAVHGGPVLDRDNPGHGHCVDRKIMQKTALGMYTLIYRFTSFYYLPILVIRKCVQCTLLVQVFCKNSFAYTEVYIRTFWAKAQFKLCSIYAVLLSRNFVRDRNL